MGNELIKLSFESFKAAICSYKAWHRLNQSVLDREARLADLGTNLYFFIRAVLELGATNICPVRRQSVLTYPEHRLATSVLLNPASHGPAMMLCKRFMQLPPVSSLRVDYRAF
jgi:hypothetical protein